MQIDTAAPVRFSRCQAATVPDGTGPREVRDAVHDCVPTGPRHRQAHVGSEVGGRRVSTPDVVGAASVALVMDKRSAPRITPDGKCSVDFTLVGPRHPAPAGT